MLSSLVRRKSTFPFGIFNRLLLFKNVLNGEFNSAENILNANASARYVYSFLISYSVYGEDAGLHFFELFTYHEFVNDNINNVLREYAWNWLYFLLVLSDSSSDIFYRTVVNIIMLLRASSSGWNLMSYTCCFTIYISSHAYFSNRIQDWNVMENFFMYLNCPISCIILETLGLNVPTAGEKTVGKDSHSQMAGWRRTWVALP